jgi:threonine synthase
VAVARDAGLIGPADAVAVLVTGHGLKDPGAALGTCAMPEPVPPLA